MSGASLKNGERPVCPRFSVGFAIFFSGFFLIFPELLFAGAVFFGGALSIGIGELLMLLGVITGAMGIGFALNPPGPRLPPSECQ
jgi:hypothetical protein